MPECNAETTSAKIIVHLYLDLRSKSDEGPMLETLDYTIRIGSIPTFLYFDLYLTHRRWYSYILAKPKAVCRNLEHNIF